MSPLRLSLCMILKNEESFLPRFLEAHQNLFDEWIMVDTGSSDASRGIIQAAGIPDHRFDWCDDFAAARNYALSLCTGDWILALDADEFLDPEAQTLLRSHIESCTSQALELPIKNYISEERMQELGSAALVEYTPPDGSYRHWKKSEEDCGYRLTHLLRSFRRDCGLHWHSPIHEVLVPKGAARVQEERLDSICIHHLGMLHVSEEKAAAKQRNYKALGQSLYAQALTSRDPKLLFEAARVLPDLPKKLEALLEAHSLAPKESAILKALANCYLEMGAADKARAACAQMTVLDPGNLEGYLGHAQCRASVGEADQAFDELKLKFDLFKRHSLYHYSLAQLAIDARRYPEALSHAERAHKLAPDAASFRELRDALRDVRNRKNLPI